MARGWLTRLRHARAARIEARAALRLAPDLGDLTLGRCLMAKSGRAVFAGRMRGARVAVKLIRSGDRAEPEVTGMEMALTRVWPRMADGPCRVPEPIAFHPDLGLAVMAHVHGRRVSDVLARADSATAARMATRAAEWLDCFAADQRRLVPFQAKFWTWQREQRQDEIADATDRAQARRLLVVLKMLGARLQGQTVPQVRPHGDFWGHNLLWDGKVLTAVDLTSGPWQPPERDAARYLVAAMLTSRTRDGPLCHGLPAIPLEAMANAPLFSAAPQGLLRFMIGIELHHRLVQESRFPRQMAKVRAAVASLIAE